MKIYLVGGAVRDKLLGMPNTDKDYVVVGATPQDMLDLGFIQVGSHFPVFLHPHTKEEYALARTEIKQGTGHKGFQVNAHPDISLEEDLSRRDLTINAMAMDNNEVLYDPHGGLKDLQDRILRHVSCAFQEDPLRVLRTFRFQASLSHLGFKIAPKTKAMMLKLIETGELSSLSGARILLELKKVFDTGNPAVFFQLAQEYGVFAYILKSCKHLRHSFKLLPNIKEFPYSHLTGLSFLAGGMSERELHLFQQEIPLPKHMKIVCIFVQKWLYCLPPLEQDHIPSILRFMKCIPRSYLPTIKQVLENLMSILSLKHPVEKLWDIYAILDQYNYRQDIKRMQHFPTEKDKIQVKLVKQYLTNLTF